MKKSKYLYHYCIVNNQQQQNLFKILPCIGYTCVNLEID